MYVGDNDSSKKIRSNTVNYLKQARISRGMGENLTDPIEEEYPEGYLPHYTYMYAYPGHTYIQLSTYTYTFQ